MVSDLLRWRGATLGWGAKIGGANWGANMGWDAFSEPKPCSSTCLQHQGVFIYAQRANCHTYIHTS